MSGRYSKAGKYLLQNIVKFTVNKASLKLLYDIVEYNRKTLAQSKNQALDVCKV